VRCARNRYGLTVGATARLPPTSSARDRAVLDRQLMVHFFRVDLLPSAAVGVGGLYHIDLTRSDGSTRVKHALIGTSLASNRSWLDRRPA
jgi:hypothetical protein